jgi:hypothetical protein
MVQKDPQQFTGKIVIWGGRIIDVINDSTGSQLMILESKLNKEEYPLTRSSDVRTYRTGVIARR